MPRPVTDPLWGRRRRAFRSSPTPPRVAYPLDAHVPPAVRTVGGRMLMGHPHNRVLLPAHLHHPQPGLHRGRHLDRRLLQPLTHPHQPRRHIPHRRRTAPSGPDVGHIIKPSTTCTQAQYGKRHVPQPNGYCMRRHLARIHTQSNGTIFHNFYDTVRRL